MMRVVRGIERSPAPNSFWCADGAKKPDGTPVKYKKCYGR